MLSSFIAHQRELVGTLVPAMGGVVLLISRQRRIKAWLDPYFAYFTGLSWFVTRVGLYMLIYVFCVLPGSFGELSLPYDVRAQGGWVYESTRILAGQMPYRDFFSNYSILFSYIISLPYRVWHSPAAFVPILILFDLGCVFLIYAVGKLRWNTALAKEATLVYVLLPITWYVEIRHVQDEVLLAFFALLAAYFWMRNKQVLSSVLLGLGFCCTKFMFAIIMFPFWLASRRKVRDALVMAGVILAINLPFILAGANALRPVSNLEGRITGGGLWPAVMEISRISMHSRPLFYIAVASFFIPIVVASVLIVKRRIYPPDAVCVLMMIAIALSPETVPFYYLAYMPFFIVYAVARKQVVNLTVFIVLALTVPKFYLFMPKMTLKHDVLMAVYALYITVMPLYWVVQILRTPSDHPAVPAGSSGPALPEATGH